MKPRPRGPASALKQPLSAGVAARGALGQSRVLGGCLAPLEKPAQRLCFIGEGGRSRLGTAPAAGSVLGASSGHGRASKTAATRRGEAKRAAGTERLSFRGLYLVTCDASQHRLRGEGVCNQSPGGAARRARSKAEGEEQSGAGFRHPRAVLRQGVTARVIQRKETGTENPAVSVRGLKGLLHPPRLLLSRAQS